MPELPEVETIVRGLRRSVVGRTISRVYSGIDRDPGRFQEHLRVYNNEGGPCRSCGTKIVREKIGSRSAHYCPRCQRP